MKKLIAVRVAVIFLVLLFTAGVSLAAEKKAASQPGMKTETKTETKTVTKETATKGKIDINSASREELVKLPGIGEATAQKIIDNRPYKSKDQLKSKKIVSAAEYDKIKEKIIAHQKKK